MVRQVQAGLSLPEDEPCFVISVAARLLGVHQQTLRYYERMGLIEPSRSRGNLRLYSERDVERIRQIKRLLDDLGVNLAGVEVILNMSERITVLEQQMDTMRTEADMLRRRLRTQVIDIHVPPTSPHNA